MKHRNETPKQPFFLIMFSSSTETALFMTNIFYRCYLQWQERQDTGAQKRATSSLPGHLNISNRKEEKKLAKNPFKVDI